MNYLNIDREWDLRDGMFKLMNTLFEDKKETVNLPHDYMIGSDVLKTCKEGAASGFYSSGIKNYTKYIEIPAEWEEEVVYLLFDGIMQNATVEINGNKAVLQHNGYIPFSINITPYIYFGESNRITVSVNPCTEPNSRWYSGAGIFRSVRLAHAPRIHIDNDGVYAYTKDIDYNEEGIPKYAYLQVEVDIVNETLEDHLAEVEVVLTDLIKSNTAVRRKTMVQVKHGSKTTAYVPITVKAPLLWDDVHPDLYKMHVLVKDKSIFKTRAVPVNKETCDEESLNFGIRTISADSVNGLRINGKTVKLKGGCVHHDNGMLGAVSLYDAEYRKLSKMKESGFNAVRTAHNPPSREFLDVCDRLGMYVLNEAFDSWGMAKKAGDYNLFFESDWKSDLTRFIRRDRSRPSVIIWSTGNEIVEHGGLNNGYVLATEIAEYVKTLDRSRPVTNAICSFWCGQDDRLTGESFEKLKKQLIGQNEDMDEDGDTDWENQSEPFTNGLDIVGYNYMESKYQQDHELYPDRVMLGSENYGNQIGRNWPLVEKLPYVIGDFTWTAFDHIGEAGLGKGDFFDEGDPRLNMGGIIFSSENSEYPWRLANSADFDINGNLTPQGAYRRVVWGADDTYLYAYSPQFYGKIENYSKWGFPAVTKNWNYKGMEGRGVQIFIITPGDEVELFLNGRTVGKSKVEKEAAAELPYTVRMDTLYEPGELTAVSYRNRVEISRDRMKTSGHAVRIRLVPEKAKMKADGHSLIYVSVQLVDQEGQPVYNECLTLRAAVEGAGTLAAFGSENPVTDENYTTGVFSSYQGRATAIIRSGYESGKIRLKVSGEGIEEENIILSSENV